jgi:hypothetical protein
MKPISDRTLAELVAARLRAAGLFELFIRELARGEWYASARGFRRDGRMYRAEARDDDLTRVFLALLAQVDAVAGTPAESAPERPYLERVALELADRRAGVTLLSFTDATYERGFACDAIARCAEVLAALVAAGELRQEGAVYRLASGAVQTSALGSEVSDAEV